MKEELILALVFIVLSAAAIMVAYYGRDPLKKYLAEKGLEDALGPWADAAIMQAYKLSEWSVDVAQERLHGFDKARAAAMLYDRLPDTIEVFGLDIEPKRYISLEDWNNLVLKSFDVLERKFILAQADLQESFLEWNASG